MADRKRIVVAMTGATGLIYGVRLIEALSNADVDVHLVVSEWARKTLAIETDLSYEDVRALAARTYDASNQAAALSSGSFQVAGMVVAPCSMKTLGLIAAGIADTLVARAADVTLKEGRRLVLMPRESPLNLIHLENMVRVARAGAIIAPPVPAFYNRPTTVDEIVDHSIGRVMDLFDIPHDLMRRWGEPRGAGGYQSPTPSDSGRGDGGDG